MKLMKMKSGNFPYFPAAVVITTIISAAGRNVQPLEKPGSLRATSSQYALHLDPHVAASFSAFAAPVKDGKGDKGDKGDKADKDDKGEKATPPPEAIKPEGSDPARQVEKDAAEVVPETLPPPEEIERNVEAEAPVQTAASLTGVKANEYGDVSTLIVTWSINALVILVCMLIFSGLRLKYPRVYSANVLNDTAPYVPSETFLGWISASWGLTTEIVANTTTGLDAAMVLEYFNMNIKILAIIGIPMVCIMCPLHFYLGGGGIPATGIRSIAMANVIEHHPWLYYVHALVINLVTIVIIKSMYATMPKFMKLRYGWLKCQASPRCSTVLVEGIPPEWRSDKKLRDFFGALFHPSHINEAIMVKNIPQLKTLYDEQKLLQEQLSEAEDIWEHNDHDEEKRPMMSERMCFGPKIDTIKHCEEKLAKLGPEVEEARCAALKEAETVGGINSSSGFVTFKQRRQAAICQHVILSPHRSEWVVTAPPPASDVLWSDLQQDDQKKTLYSLIAYGLVVAIYAFFIPVVVMGTNLANMIDLGPVFQPIWASFAPGLALMLCLAFLPTVFLLIFRSFFTLKADSFAQHMLQIWYFVFLLFFVVLVTCIGQSLWGTFKHVMRNPETAMWLMAEHMPTATQFYMEFLMLQWSQQATNFLRTSNLAKYLIFWKVLGHEEEVAKDLSEPEDQDYYGIGSRSARFSVNMLIGIIFSTLSPLIALFAMVLFMLCRLFYGYLMVFAETKKPDLGGVFFITKLQHMFLGTFIYNILMIGVLLCRAKSKFPMILALPSLIYTIASYRHFTTNFVWNDLPFTEASFHTQKEDVCLPGMCYMQPELIKEEVKQDDKKTIVSRRSSLSDDSGNLVTPRFLGEEGARALFPGNEDEESALGDSD